MAPIIVLFDGVCNLCNGLVDYAIRRDKAGRLRFAAQQSAAGQRLLAEAGLSDAAGQTVVVLAGDARYTGARAALEIARRLGFPAALLYGFVAVPACVRDPVYRWLARHRYRWFGKRESCRIPSADEQARFIA